MNSSASNLSKTQLRKDRAARAKQRFGFWIFVLLLIHSAADGLIRDKLGIPDSLGPSFFCYRGDYDPLASFCAAPNTSKEEGEAEADTDEDLDIVEDAVCDMEPILADLDAFTEHGGQDSCWLPSRHEVLSYWNNINYNLKRNAIMNADGGPFEFRLPSGYTPDNTCVIGDGLVLMGTAVVQHCIAFIEPYLYQHGGRQLNNVDGRYLGLVSVASQPGDQVWVLPGLHVPAILRPI